jgi:hypothetical protein
MAKTSGRERRFIAKNAMCHSQALLNIKSIKEKNKCNRNASKNLLVTFPLHRCFYKYLNIFFIIIIIIISQYNNMKR